MSTGAHCHARDVLCPPFIQDDAGIGGGPEPAAAAPLRQGEKAPAEGGGGTFGELNEIGTHLYRTGSRRPTLGDMIGTMSSRRGLAGKKASMGKAGLELADITSNWVPTEGAIGEDGQPSPSHGGGGGAGGAPDGSPVGRAPDGSPVKGGAQQGDAAKASKAVTKLSWKEGVLVPCLLNIWGVIMFLRLGWTVGQAGIVVGTLIIVLSNVVTLITALSMSAICTNGEVEGGGCYYLISRSLGPAVGGCIGILFFIAQAVATSMYVIGFAEAVIDIYKNGCVGTLKAVGCGGAGCLEAELTEDFILEQCALTGDWTWDLRWIGLGTTLILLCVALVGVGWYAKCQIFLLVALVVSMIAMVVGVFLPAVPNLEENRNAGFVGFGEPGARLAFSSFFFRSFMLPNPSPSLPSDFDPSCFVAPPQIKMAAHRLRRRTGTVFLNPPLRSRPIPSSHRPPAAVHRICSLTNYISLFLFFRCSQRTCGPSFRGTRACSRRTASSRCSRCSSPRSRASWPAPT